MSIVFYAPRDSKAGVCFSDYTSELLQKHPNFFFVFGDNLTKAVGTGGQAIIRNEPNALGLVTKRLPFHTPDVYMTGTDEDYYHVDKDLANIKNLLSSGATILFPAAGLGTGLARLQTTAPDLLSYIDSEVSKLIHADYRLIREHKR
jgi:hypothetical protein